MIPEKIQNLFCFIDFLHANIDSFKQYDHILSDLIILDNERFSAKQQKNFSGQQKCNQLQIEIDNKFEIIDIKIIQVIKSKAEDLNICAWDDIETIWNYNFPEICNMKNNCSAEDAKIINQIADKYVEFRSSSHDYFQTNFFRELDYTLKELFSYFHDNGANVFEAFEPTKISEASEQKHTNAEPVKKRGRKPQPEPNKTLGLLEVFEIPDKYESIMQYLIDNRYCHQQTRIYLDNPTNTKEKLAAFIKYLHTLRLLKDNKKLTANQIKIISQNTFGCDININTINKADPKKYKTIFSNIDKYINSNTRNTN